MKIEIEKTIYFDLTNEDIKNIGIFETWKKNNCFISQIENRNKIYSGFILRNGPRAQTICSISFHPSSKSGKYIPRLEFKIINKKTGEIKVSTNKDFVRIAFNSTGEDGDGCDKFWEMISFLSEFKDLVDIGNFKEKYKVTDASGYIAVFKSKSDADKVKELSKIIQDSNLSEQTIKLSLAGTRKNSLDQFNKLLADKNSIEEYRNKFNILQSGDESIWHHFLKYNPWILGLSVDIKFIRELYPEQNLGVPNTDGKGSPKADMIGIRDYTVLIELKTSETKIFTDNRKNTSRTNTWSLSDDFIDGVSQCLAQKSDWDKSQKIKSLINPETDEILNQDNIRTIDPKVIFIIGRKDKELPEKSMLAETHIKRDTLERFRRNSRNIDIITFDELYERAYFIVNGIQLSQ
ncbi:MAG: Shedu immune nuclease family protein [Patescibacteria group bacterium]